MPHSDRFRALLEAQPGNDLFRFSLGKALLDEGKPAEAQLHFTACRMARADWMQAFILEGQCAAQLGQTAQARSAWERALQLAREQEHEDPRQTLEGWLAGLQG